MIRQSILPNMHAIAQKNIQILIILLAFSFFAIVVVAQPRNAGKVISYERTDGGVRGKTSVGIFDVRAYSDHIIRVRISQKTTFDQFSYALADPDRKPMNEVECA